jgi:hypothetical protein
MYLNNQIRVYRNLNKKTFSYQKKTKKGWRVAGWSDEILIQNATFRVSQAGRARVIREKRKNVHAYIIGDPIYVRGLTKKTPILKNFKTKLYYNPYKTKTFMNTKNNKSIHNADSVLVNLEGIWI